MLCETPTDGCGDVDRKGREKEVSVDTVGFGRMSGQVRRYISRGWPERLNLAVCPVNRRFTPHCPFSLFFKVLRSGRAVRVGW